MDTYENKQTEKITFSGVFSIELYYNNINLQMISSL